MTDWLVRVCAPAWLELAGGEESPAAPDPWDLWQDRRGDELAAQARLYPRRSDSQVERLVPAAPRPPGAAPRSEPSADVGDGRAKPAITRGDQ